MPRIPKGSKGTLGKSIMKSLNKKKYVPGQQAMQEAKFIHLENNNEDLQKQQKQNLASVIDQDNLDEFLVTAEQAEKKYDAERGIKVAKDQQGHEIIYNLNKEEQEQDYDVKKNKLLSRLRIPRKPKWNTQMSKKELISAENEAFLMWRRGLAQIEKDYYTVHITPYEKNIEVWKQLWRVVERSDILVQIVDGRDPLFYRCEDLESYVKESGSFKQNFLLINKSDLLSEEMRKAWNKYFIENGVDHMFFSAKQEQEKINSLPDEKNNVLFDLELEMEGEQKQENYVNSPNISNRKNLIYSLQQFVKQQQQRRKQQLFNEKIEIMQKKENGEETKEDNFDEILKNIDDELDLDDAGDLDEAVNENKAKKEQNVKKNPNLVTIGMVGYPNVGKSSVINALCNKKLVGVGNMPGKTKAFQTVFIQDDVLLCDCPGLVFPNAGSTRAEMVLNGVLPIDRIIDYLGPVDLLVQRVPIVVFEQLYSLKIGLNQINAEHLLRAYAMKKGYVRNLKEPDEAKSAKLILKNVINGILIFCKLPPNHDEQKHGKIWQSNDLEKLKQLRNNNNQKQINNQDPNYKYTLDEHLYLQNEDNLENKVFQDELDENAEILFDDDDLVRLMEGQRVQNIKLTKQQRREIKFSFQRGEKIDFKKYLKKDQIQSYYKPKVNNKNPIYL